jgi:inner membrane protein
VDPYRYRWRFTPVEVSPLSIRLFFSEWGLRVLWSELRWVIAPAAAVVAVVQGIRWWVAARARGQSTPA